MTEHPYRRHEDYVSFRDMVEYVAESDARYHAARSESLIQISNALEKIEVRMDKHDEWHREVLERLLTERRSNGIAIIAVLVSIAALAANALTVLTH